jgi:catechol 2,3-dioxygenase-like lactoylglutathione lyase family enzyme
MAILLDHLIVPSHHPVASAQSLADILAVPWEAERGHFTPVYVNETLTLDFAQREQFDRHHYCFHVNDEEFDGIFARVRAAGISYRSTPGGPADMQLNTRLGGRNFYWNDSDGHNWEVLTVSYARPQLDVTVGLASS